MPPVGSMRDSLCEATVRMEDFLGKFFRQNAERYAYGPLFEPIYHDLSEFVMRKGKRIRPLLFLASYTIFGGTKSLQDAALQQSATSLELLHAFILIHDDVIDRSEVRRGLPTFHKLMEQQLGKLPDRERLGGNLAIVLGDMLFALAVDTMLQTDFPAVLRDAALRKFLQYITDTGCGEAHDILLGARDISRVSAAEIETMYHLKTTRYTFEAPLLLGALLAGAESHVLDEVARLAEPIGLAFQIQNDLIEYSHFDLLDRAVQTDLVEGKKTLLVRVAYERLQDVDRSFLQLCLQTPSLQDSAILKVREMIDKSGAVGVLQTRREQLMIEAEERLQITALNEEARQALREVIQIIRQMVHGNQ